MSMMANLLWWMVGFILSVIIWEIMKFLFKESKQEHDALHAKVEK